MRRARAGAPRPGVALGLGVALSSLASGAAGSNGLESPSSGVNQMSRGGAWFVRGDDPLATYFNPAAIVRNPTGVHLGAQLMFRSQCFDRRDSEGQPVAPGDAVDVAPPEPICASGPPFPNPQLAATFRIHRQLGLGLAVIGPHAAGGQEWEPTVRYPNRFGAETDAPNPARYMMLENDAILLFPTLSLSYAPLKSLSIGAGFTWGIASFGFSNAAEASSPPKCPDPDDMAPCPAPGNPQEDNFTNDIFARVEGFDGFVPGFVASVLYSPLRQLDIAGWYRFSDAIRSNVDLTALAPYYSPSGQLNDSPTTTEIENAGTFELPIPMEAKLGFRYHHPREGAQSQDFVAKHRGWARDAFSQDLFDIELDLTWAHNSQVDAIDIRLRERYEIDGTPGRVPLDASIPHPWKDVFGARLGGEYVAIPDLLAARLGGFFESRGVSAEYLHVDFHLSERVGIAGGLALRLGPVDLTAAYQHTFFFPLDNGGAGQIKGISGDESVGDFRTRQAVNGGRATASLDEVGLGITYHYFAPTL